MYLALTLVILAFAPSLKPSAASQQRQNRAIDRLGLTRIQDRAQLESMIRSGLLVPIEDTSAYELDQYLGAADPGHEGLYRHARPWVRDFLDRELGAAQAATGARFRVSSLVRTAAYQRALVRGGNRAAISGTGWWRRSSHVTGSTMDISWLDLDPAAVAWLRRRLLKLERAGLIEAIMESYNRCFHVMVFPAYSP